MTSKSGQLREVRGETESQEEFPSQTGKYMSWQAKRFIQVPSSSTLQWVTFFLLLSLVCALTASRFVMISTSLNAEGELAFENSPDELKAPANGVIDKFTKRAGDEVIAGETIAVFLPEGARSANSTLSASSAGILAKWIASEGQRVTQGAVVALEQTDLQAISARLHVSARDVAQLRPGQKVRYRIDAYQGGLFEGEILSVDQIREPAAAVPNSPVRFLVTASLAQRKNGNTSTGFAHRLIEGMPLSATIVTGQKTLWDLASERAFRKSF